MNPNELGLDEVRITVTLHRADGSTRSLFRASTAWAEGETDQNVADTVAQGLRNAATSAEAFERTQEDG